MSRGELPIVFVTRTRCPSCGSVRLHVYKSVPREYGNRLRYCECLDCLARCKVMVEPDSEGGV